MSLKKPTTEKIGNVTPFGLRMLPDLKRRIEEAADKSGRSLNAEIVTRLDRSLDGNLPDLSAEGFAALIKQMEATVETSFQLVFDLRDTLPGLDKFMAEEGIDRQEAVRRIMQDWLTRHGYLAD